MKKTQFVSMALGLFVTSSWAQQAPTLALNNGTPANSWKVVSRNQRRGADQIDPSVQIRIYASVCPAIEAGNPVWDTYAGNVQSFWSGTTREGAGIDPQWFYAITRGRWQEICVDTTGQFPMWLGVPTPGGAQRGSGISFPVDIKSPNTTFSLDGVVFTLWSWDAPNSLGYSPTFSRYYPELRGLKDGITITSGSSSAQVNELQYVGSRVAYDARNQAGLDAVRNYVSGVSGYGVSCKVELMRGGFVVARAQLDIPFNPSPARLIQLDKDMLYIGEIPNRQYRVEGTATPTAPHWLPLGDGLPVFAGRVDVSTLGNPKMAVFRVHQGP